MGRGRGKGKKLSLTDNNGDPASGEDEKTPAQKRRGRPHKPLMDEDVEKIEEDDDYDEDDDENASPDLNGSKRKRDKEGKKKGNLVKDESPNGTRSNGFRHVGSRRKNKPHRAAEVGVECT